MINYSGRSSSRETQTKPNTHGNMTTAMESPTVGTPTSTTNTSTQQKPYMSSRDNTYDPNEAYRLTQSRILSLQETILDSSKDAKPKKKPEPPTEDEKKREERSLQKVATKNTTVGVDSSNILNYIRDKYKEPPKIIKWLNYNPYGCSIEDPFTNSKDNATILDNKLNVILNQAPPFLPILNYIHINKIISVYIPAEIISNYLNGDADNKRWVNREIWGSDVYTDDSDLLLVLSHLGVFQSITSPSSSTILQRTPVNPKDKDHVIGHWDPNHVENTDLIVNLLILDTLQSYQGSNRFGLRSRDWLGPQLHDGLSYGIYSIEFKHRTDLVTVSSWN